MNGWLFYGINVGKYNRPMDPIAWGNSWNQLANKYVNILERLA